MTLPAMHGWTHRPKALGGTDPIEVSTSTTLPTAICTGSGFTAEDGAGYYALAQLVGCDPSAFGVMDQIEIVNDPADGSGVFYVQTVGGVQGVLRIVNGYMELAYSAVVVFAAPVDTTTVTATLYMGTGVGGGSTRLGWEQEHLELVASQHVEPRLRVSGHLELTAEFFEPFGVLGTRPDLSPILLVEGGDVDVLHTQYNLTMLTALPEPSVFFTP